MRLCVLGCFAPDAFNAWGFVGDAQLYIMNNIENQRDNKNNARIIITMMIIIITNDTNNN